MVNFGKYIKEVYTSMASNSYSVCYNYWTFKKKKKIIHCIFAI